MWNWTWETYITYTQCFHEEATCVTRHANLYVCLQELPNLFIICLQLLPKDRWEVLIIVLTNHGNCHSAICFPSSQSGWITFVSCSRLYNARHCHRLPWTSLALTFQFPAVPPVLLFPFQDGVNEDGIFCVLWISYGCYSCQDWINLQNWISLQPTDFPIEIHHEESCWFPSLKISDRREAVNDFRHELPFPDVLYT